MYRNTILPSHYNRLRKMFKNPKFNLVVHAMGNLTAQAGAIEFVQEPVARSIVQVIFALLGVLIAYSDQSIAKQNGNTGK